MENFEIILMDFEKKDLASFVNKELNLKNENIKNSHFFDSKNNQDLEFKNVNNIIDVLSPIGTGNIFLEYLEFGIFLKEPLIIFSFDESIGDITINFSDENFNLKNVIECKKEVNNLVDFLSLISKKYNFSKIRLGYELASDQDTCLFEMHKEILKKDDIVKCVLNNFSLL